MASFSKPAQSHEPVLQYDYLSYLRGVPIALIFVEPDLGMSVLYVSVWFVMIWLAGLPLSHFAILAVLGLAQLRPFSILS
ncbi:MAG: FtsW/RodA/SpoVE family cell cycle protein [Anaerolineaceae bacterium]|nr:FtsW/RodA/SpoVE family cell cycle protein [Anaerolineaceae bacterium]